MIMITWTLDPETIDETDHQRSAIWTIYKPTDKLHVYLYTVPFYQREGLDHLDSRKVNCCKFLSQCPPPPTFPRDFSAIIPVAYII